MRLLWFLLGAAVLFVALSDAIGTLVTTRDRKAGWWPTNWFYRHSWRLWRLLGVRMRNEDRRERTLSAYGPLSLLFLLTIWVGLEILGWGLIWWGMRESFNAIHSIGDAWYFAGVNYFTVGFGDIVPVEIGARLLTVFAAFTGITTSALVIGFLPTLYGAYSQREQQLLLLDDLSGTHVTPVGLIDAYASQGDLSRLYTFLGEWESWAASVLETHTAYRMLVLFRSRRTGQSWLIAIGVVTDTAVTVMACVRGAGVREPLRLYRRSTELLSALTKTYHVQTHEARPQLADVSEEAFRQDYDRLGALGFELRPYALAWQDVRSLREAYVPQLTVLSRALLSPTTFRNPEIQYPDVLAHLAAEAEAAAAGPDDEPAGGA